MKKPYSKEQHEIMRNSRNFQRGNTEEQRKALVKALLAKEAKDRANKAADILYEAFEKDFTIAKEEKRRYHIAKKGVIIQLKWLVVPVEWKTILWEGQMIMEVDSKGYLKFFLATIDGNRAYTGSNLSNNDLKAELPGLKAFISQGTALPSTSKLIKESNTSDYNDEDMDEMLAGYLEDPEGSKPK